MRSGLDPDSARPMQLGRVRPGIPLFGNRHYSLTIPGSPTGGPVGENQLIWYDEMFSGEIGQVGTQFDGLGHIGTRKGNQDIFYNGFTRSEVGSAYGLEKLGVENVGVFFTRGVLVDVVGYKGLERLEVGYVITAADIEGALKKQAVAVTEGDVVLIRTGHGKLWMVDNETYNSGQPGIWKPRGGCSKGRSSWSARIRGRSRPCPGKTEFQPLLISISWRISTSTGWRQTAFTNSHSYFCATAEGRHRIAGKSVRGQVILFSLRSMAPPAPAGGL